MLYAQIHLTLPAWIHDAIDPQTVCVDDEAKIAFAIELSRQNIAHESGGPFGAAVFDEASGRLIGLGVNRVLQQNCSVAHAEMMACMTAQSRMQRSRLNEDGMRIVLPGDPGYDDIIDGKLPPGVTAGTRVEGREIAR